MFVGLEVALCFRGFVLIGSLITVMSGNCAGGVVTGDAPGTSFSELLGQVRDPASADLFRMMMLSQMKLHAALENHTQSNQQVASVLVSIQTAVEATQTDIAAIKAHPVFQSPYPVVVHADSRTSDTTSSSGSGLSGESASSHVDDGPLHCPFCTHSHSSERIHHQHMHRIALRYVLTV